MEKRSVGMELRSLNHLIRRYFERSGSRKQINKITGTNGWIIGYLAEHADSDIYQKNVEEHFCITRSTASKVLNLMEQKGLVKRQSVSHDLRLKKLVLTPKAWEVSEWMKQDAAHMEEILTRGFSESELENLFSYIQRMKNNIKQ